MVKYRTCFSGTIHGNVTVLLRICSTNNAMLCQRRDISSATLLVLDDGLVGVDLSADITNCINRHIDSHRRTMIKRSLSK